MDCNHVINRIYTNNCPINCEPSFSWSPCDRCNSTLGGDRHSAKEWEHETSYDVEICVDCLVELDR